MSHRCLLMKTAWPSLEEVFVAAKQGLLGPYGDRRFQNTPHTTGAALLLVPDISGPDQDSSGSELLVPLIAQTLEVHLCEQRFCDEG